MTGKIVVPEGMIKVAEQSYCEADPRQQNNVTAAASHVLEAALRWLSENPILPASHNTCEEMHRTVNAKGYCCYQSALLAEWQRRMFLSPEPEIPAEIADLMWARLERDGCDAEDHNKEIIEAYRRGQNSVIDLKNNLRNLDFREESK